MIYSNQFRSIVKFGYCTYSTEMNVILLGKLLFLSKYCFIALKKDWYHSLSMTFNTAIFTSNQDKRSLSVSLSVCLSVSLCSLSFTFLSLLLFSLYLSLPLSLSLSLSLLLSLLLVSIPLCLLPISSPPSLTFIFIQSTSNFHITVE